VYIGTRETAAAADPIAVWLKDSIVVAVILLKIGTISS